MNTKNWKLKDVLLIAISAVLFGVVYLGCTYIGGVLYGMLTPFGIPQHSFRESTVYKGLHRVGI